MKSFAAILAALALASPITCQNTCTVDDVLLSMTTINHYVSQMQSDVDSSGDSIDPAGPVYQNFRSIVTHLTGDITCNITINTDDQVKICGAFDGVFAVGQLNYLHVADGLQFYVRNRNGPNAVKMHEYITQYQVALQGYTDRVKALVPTCSSDIDTAYRPLAKQLVNLLQDYTGST